MRIPSLRGKSTILVVLTLAALLVALFATSHIILLGSYRQLEEKQTRRNVERVREAVANDIDYLDQTTNDYAAWDDTYAFVHDVNETYIHGNLLFTTFTQIMVDLMVFVDSSGRLAYSDSYNHHSGKKLAFPQAFQSRLPDILRQRDKEGKLLGVLMLPEGPLLFAARPILTSERKGPTRGTVIMGRYLDAGEVDRLSGITHLSFAPYRVADPHLPDDLVAVRPLLSDEQSILVRPLDKSSIAGYTLLFDVFGQPALLLRVDLPREIYQQGKSSIRYFLSWVTIIGLGVVVLTHWLMGKLVLSRQQQERSEQSLAYLATHHPATGLPNRTLLLDRLRQALAYSRRYQLTVAVLQIDLDNFKVVNDSLGHSAGDRLLKAAARRLGKRNRAGDTLAQLGGDDFVLLLPYLAEAQRAAIVAQKLLAVMKRPFSVAGKKLFITASIGITVAPLDGVDAETLLRNADIALYQAKEQGRNTYQFFAQDMNIRTMARLTLETDLRRALEREEFLLHYQPRIDVPTGRITGMEALVRWQHPERGLVPPLEFIPLAEETGLILPLGEWVLRTACAQNRAWQQGGLPALRVSVNLSALQLRQPDLIERIEQILVETGLDPRHLELEITESILMKNVESTLLILARLREAGIALAMDDFGTGYSSLSYLKRFPLDLIKIDYSFVRDLTRDASDAALVRTIIAMASNLNLHSVAEGVETAEQLAFLRRHGCDTVQGFYFSPPVPAEEFVKLFRSTFPWQQAGDQAPVPRAE